MDGQSKYTFTDFVRINREFSSELFLSVMITLQSQITCSSNFYTYLSNYRKLMNGTKQLTSPVSSDAPTCYTTPKNCENDDSSKSSIFEMDSNTNT